MSRTSMYIFWSVTAPRFRRLGALVIFMATCLVSNFGIAQDQRPISDIVSYKKFTDLLRVSLGKVPELQELWAWQSQRGNQVYVGGDTLNNLLHWLQAELQYQSIEQVKELKIPSITDVLWEKGGSLVLYAPDRLIPIIRAKFPSLNHWQIYGNEKYSDKIRLGGTTLDIVRLNPKNFHDPLLGLKHFYEGSLAFRRSNEGEFKRINSVQKTAITRTSQALRFLSLGYLFPYLKPDPESILSIQKISESEIPWKLSELAYSQGIKPALLDLYVATGNDLPETLVALKKYNLLAILAKNGVTIPSRYKLTSFVEILKQRGFLVQELKLIEKIMHANVHEREVSMNAVLSQVNNAQEFLLLIEFSREDSSDVHKEMMARWLKINLTRFFELNPSIAEVNKLRVQFKEFPGLRTGLLEGATSLIKNVENFLELTKLDNKVDTIVEQEMDLWVRKNLELFFSFNPNLNQATQLKSRTFIQSETLSDIYDIATKVYGGALEFSKIEEVRIRILGQSTSSSKISNEVTNRCSLALIPKGTN